MNKDLRLLFLALGREILYLKSAYSFPTFNLLRTNEFVLSFCFPKISKSATNKTLVPGGLTTKCRSEDSYSLSSRIHQQSVINREVGPKSPSPI